MTISPDVTQAVDGSDAMRRFIPHSPFVQLLGIRLVELGDGTAELVMPYRPELTTIGDMVHGGALAAAADIGLMVAAWAGRPVPDKVRGVTTSLTVTFLTPLEADDLRVVGSTLHAGRQLVHGSVELRAAADGRLVATALGTYKVG